MAKMNISPSDHPVGSSERIFLSHVNDLNDFYLHSAWTKKKLVEFCPKLVKAYSQSSTTSSTRNETFNIGDYYAFPSRNENWYRGQICDLNLNGHATVLKIDYGHIQYISTKRLRPLEQWMYDVPRLAFHCSLANLVKPITGWSSEAIDHFRSRLAKPFLYAKIISYNETTGISEVEITEKESTISLNKEFEQYQIERSPLQINDKHVYIHFPMAELDSINLNHICLLYYMNPSRFYVNLQDKRNAHHILQINLGKAAENLPPITSLVKYQLVAVQNNLGLWLRAIILDFNGDLSKICVYFIDVGQTEFILIKNIRQLPNEFLYEPAFAIPCRLYNIYPINGNEQSIWKSDDKVHDEFKKLMVNIVSCTVRSKTDRICYDTEINIPQKGDLGTFLIENNLVSRTTMSYSQRPNITTDLSSTIRTVPSDDGYYWIPHIYSAAEFYGFSKYRQREFVGLCKDLKVYHDNFVNDQSLSVTAVLEGMLCVIQECDKCYRVIIKHRESESKVLVKFIDRGDEIVADISELLQIDNKFSTIPAFVQPFCLYGYDKSQNPANVTHTLKNLLFNQWVYVAQRGLIINGLYPVEVILPDQRSLNQMIRRQ